MAGINDARGDTEPNNLRPLPVALLSCYFLFIHLALRPLDQCGEDATICAEPPRMSYERAPAAGPGCESV